MAYAKEFFDLQLHFVQKVSELSGLPVTRTILEYTNLYVRFGLGGEFLPARPAWQIYIDGFQKAADGREWRVLECPMLLQDKVILITGSTTGVGEAIARRSVAEGARVMLHGLEAELAKQICRDLGDAASYVIADLGEISSCARLVEATVQHFGAIHGLVNNAANLGRSNLDTTTPEFFDKIIAVNVRAPLFLIQAAMPHFRAQGGGVVLNIGSINALSGEPNLLAYSISKGGLQTLTRNLANAHGIAQVRINQINLSWVTTPNEIALKIREGLPPGWENNVPAVYAPFGKLFTPEEVASHALFWLSEQSYPANGVVFVLDQSSPYGRNPQKDFS